MAAALVATACASGASSGSGGTSGDALTLEQLASSPKEDVPSALDNILHPELPEPLVDPLEVVSGGPPPDGIPAIDEPAFVRPADARFLDDREPVLSFRIGDDARAYPVQIMTWHEIVNDTVGGVPVAVTFCPLCNSAIAYDRRLGTRVLDFGTSGMLFNSALVMYDRQTESLWSHFTAQAIAGVLTGQTLERIPVATVAWGDWRAANPDGLVLGRDTGHSRPYGRNPYVGYDNVDASPFLFRGDTDGRFPPMTRVVGLRADDDALAVPLDLLAERRVVEAEVAGREIVVWHKPGTASSLDKVEIEEGRDVGATGAFEPFVDGQRLTFEAAGDVFRDRETASTWTVLGEATAGPLAGRRLTAVDHVDTFWFAWGAFLPDSRIAE